MREDVSRRAHRLAGDLRTVFAERLLALVLYGSHASRDAQGAGEEPVETMALVERLDLADLEACARLHGPWRRSGLATPLVLTVGDFERSLDAFPLELGAIMTRHEVIVGSDPFAGLSVRADDLRRACEVQARSHVLHLREGFIEAGGDPAAIGRLVARSAGALRALLANIAALDGQPADGIGALAHGAALLTGAPAGVLAEVLALATGAPAADAARLFPPYLAAMERLVRAIDRRSGV
jgi:hypothetical protein